MQRTVRRPAPLRGFTFIEVLSSLAITSIAVLVCVEFLLTGSRISNNLSTSTTLHEKSRYSLDILTQDVQGADLILDQVTQSGTTYYSTTTSSLVLRAPAFDASGDFLSGSDYIVYRLMTPTNALDGPYQLVRTVFPVAGSLRAAANGGSNTTTLAKNVQSASFTYIAEQQLTGNGTTKVFSSPTLKFAYATPSGSSSITEAWVSGSEKCASSQASYSGSTLTFAAAPSAPPTPTVSPTPTGYTAPPNIDARASIDPSVSTTGTAGAGNAASQVFVTLTLKGGTRSGLTSSTVTPSVTLSTVRTIGIFPHFQQVTERPF